MLLNISSLLLSYISEVTKGHKRWLEDEKFKHVGGKAEGLEFSASFGLDEAMF